MYKISIEWDSSLRIVVASLSSALLVFLLSKLINLSNPIYNLTLGFLLYVASFLLFAPIFKAVDRGDLKSLEHLIDEIPIVYPFLKFILRLEKGVIELIKQSN